MNDGFSTPKPRAFFSKEEDARIVAAIVD